MGETPTEIAHFEPQTSTDAVGTSQTLNPTPTKGPQSFTSRSAPIGYVYIPQVFLTEVRKRLGMVEVKVRLIKKRVKPWVDRLIGDKIKMM